MAQTRGKTHTSDAGLALREVSDQRLHSLGVPRGGRRLPSLLTHADMYSNRITKPADHLRHPN